MREIKFRAWDKSRANMRFGEDNLMLSLGGHKYWQFGYSEPEPVAQDDEYIIMQFTGLKDKNGKEIYEGDIVRVIVRNVLRSYEPHVGVMTWNPDWCGFEVDVESTRIQDLEINLPNNPMEVIGNIYENPDLLK